MQPYPLLLHKFTDHAAKWHGDAEIVTGGGTAPATPIGYARLRDRSVKLSAAFATLGLGQGDRIATRAWNSQAHMECWYAAPGIGVVCHTLNPRIGAAALAEMAGQAGDRLLVASPDQAALVEELVALCTAVEHVLILDEPGAAGVPLPIVDGVRIWTQRELIDQPATAIPWGGISTAPVWHRSSRGSKSRSRLASRPFGWV
ncbi:MAG: AMP-binding protein [Candidatus Sphingomonas colombiensis]|nr:AMP-binding protein [Sphingomonas sp.]WEK42487.1 MAG: AMP-binding protein [Sphingomonas sp.]